MPNLGPLELTIILVIVVMIFGVGKLPDVFGSVGKGLKEFRRNAADDLSSSSTTTAAPAPTQPVQSAAPVEASAAPTQEVAAH